MTSPRPFVQRCRRTKGKAHAVGFALLLAALVIMPSPFGPARAQGLVADLSSHLIGINTGFSGTRVVLFGTTDGPGDVVLVVRGPLQDVVVRRRDRVAGIWINVESVEFVGVPSFYAVGSSRPLDRILTQGELARHEIGPDSLRLQPRSPLSGQRNAAFRAALIRNKQELSLYGADVVPITFLGDRLFRATLDFPANVATGPYSVSVYLTRDGEVVDAQTTPLVVSKVGFSAGLYEFASDRPLGYGVVAVIAAIAAGWLAAAAFRRG